MLAAVGLAACHRSSKDSPAPPRGSASPTPATGRASADGGGKGRPEFAVDAAETLEGKALWYDVPESSLAARRAWPEEMTAASDRLPQNTYMRVTRIDAAKGSDPKPVVVRVTDKAIGRRDVLIEVDRDAAGALGMVKGGEARVRVEVLALKNATADKPVEKKTGDAVVPKASELTDKPVAGVEAEKDAAKKKE